MKMAISSFNNVKNTVATNAVSLRSINRALSGLSCNHQKEPLTGVSLAISRKGTELSRKLKDGGSREKTSISTLDSKRDRVEMLLSLIDKGAEVSDEDEEFVNKELQAVASLTYLEKRNRLVTREDMESALAFLKDNYEKRLRIYTDMQEEMDANRAAVKEEADSKKIVTARLEEEQEKRLIEILEESLGLEKEDSAQECEGTGGEKEDIHTTNSSENNEEEEDKQIDPLVAQALEIIDHNREAISKINDDASKDIGEAEEYNCLMDREFLRLSDIIQRDDVKAEDKLREFEKSRRILQEFSYNKFVAQVKGQFDMETYLVSKIEFSSHDDLEDLLHRTQNQNAVKQLKMVLDYLT